MKALTNWRTIADVNDNTFTLLCNEVMFATSGVGLQVHCALASMRTDGREERKKVFVAA